MLDRPVPNWAEGGTRRFVLKCSSECEVCFRVALSPLFSSRRALCDDPRKSTLVKERGCPSAEPPRQAERGEFAWDAPHGTPSTERQAAELRFTVRTCQTLSLSVLHYRLFLSTHYVVSVPQQLVRVYVHHRGELSANTQVDLVCVFVRGKGWSWIWSLCIIQNHTSRTTRWYLFSPLECPNYELETVELSGSVLQAVNCCCRSWAVFGTTEL